MLFYSKYCVEIEAKIRNIVSVHNIDMEQFGAEFGKSVHISSQIHSVSASERWID